MVLGGFAVVGGVSRDWGGGEGDVSGREVDAAAVRGGAACRGGGVSVMVLLVAVRLPPSTTMPPPQVVPPAGVVATLPETSTVFSVVVGGVPKGFALNPGAGGESACDVGFGTVVVDSGSVLQGQVPEVGSVRRAEGADGADPAALSPSRDVVPTGFRLPILHALGACHSVQG